MQTYATMSRLFPLCLPIAQSHTNPLPLSLPKESFAQMGPGACQTAHAFWTGLPLGSHHTMELGSLMILSPQSVSAHITSTMAGWGSLSSLSGFHQTLASGLKLSPWTPL